MNIDIKLKTYEQLQNEVITLNTNSYLKDLKIEKLQSNWNSLREWLEKQISNDLDGIFSYSGRQCKETLDKMNKLEGKNK